MQARRDWRTWALVLACVLPFVGFWSTGLTDLDEGFYSAVVNDMMLRGDWITPTINGAAWFEKPILLYWLTIPAITFFGDTVGPRLPSVLCTLATAFVLFRFLRRYFSLDVARLAAAAYCGSLLVVGLGRLLMTDAPFVLALVIAFTTFWDSLNGNPKMRTWTAVALGFAVLAKGPVAGLLFLIVAGFVYWRMRELRPNFKGHWLAGSALFVLVVGAWYVPCYLVNGDVFVQQFLIEQNIGRFQGTDLAHQVPWWSHPIYFPVILFLALMPWSLWAMRAKWFQRPEDPLRRYLWIWALVPLGFFTVSLTKLPHYILPSVAPLLIITLLAVSERRAEKGQYDMWLRCALIWSVLVGVFATTVFHLDYQMRFAEVHVIAQYVRDQEGSVAIFRTGRTDSDVAISLDIDESPPYSVYHYLKRPAEMTDDLGDVLQMEYPVWVITRRGRISDDDIILAIEMGYALSRPETPFEQNQFQLWKVEPLDRFTDFEPR
ncbi:MAG: glycosyltransferase family 39 protein [Armatimonadetes bacterium]|nr:glycosyltransferase family 39 protein [Armatimonadota bacterium]